MPLQSANLQSKLPAPKASMLPKMSKIAVPSSSKRTFDDFEKNITNTKRRKLSDDSNSTSLRQMPNRKPSVRAVAANVRSVPIKANPVATRQTTSAKPVNTRAPTRSNSSGSLPKKPVNNGPAASGAGKKSRPAWDLKGRLEDMEEKVKLLSNTNREQSELKQQGEQHIQSLSSNNEQLVSEISTLRNALSEKDGALLRQRNENSQLRSDSEQLRTENAQLQRNIKSLEGDYDAAQAHVASLKRTVAEMSAAQEQIRSTLTIAQGKLDALDVQLRERSARVKELEESLATSEQLVAEQQQQIRGFETERRQLHNTIQELKGNIRVFCRVRPLLTSEAEHSDEHIGFGDDGKTLEVARLAEISPSETLGGARKGSKFEFKYDRVFTPENTQADVFDEISQLVQSALDGYNVCIFAYGQTGSGKTFTMEGAPSGAGDIDPTLAGMIPRSVALVFDFVDSLSDKGWKYTFEASFLEIYNETIRDLLGDGKDNVKHEIKMVAAKSSEVYVTNLTQAKVTDKSEVHSLLQRASESRAVAETRCNAHSSRSHSVFRLKIDGHNTHTDERCTGMLNLIDLAGSERIKDSGSEGQRLKEATAINGSLSHLGNVIMALANKDSHVPYRNSKLTHLLQNSLGGSSKVLMFVNVSPREDCASETLNSLRFATKVNNCHIGTAQKKVK